MVFVIDFTNISGEEGTVIADGGFSYTDNLNAINDANFIFSGSGELKRSLIVMGSTVKIYRNGTLEFHGLVDDIEFYDGGAMNVHASGYEIWLAKENGDYANSPWTNTASATIFSAVLAESSYFSSGTIDTGTNVDFRGALSDSLWNVISSLKTQTSQDIGIDYVNSEIDILDHKGSSTSVETLNAGIQIGDVRITHSYPIGNDVRVYGKGDGANQIKSSAAQGQDATSKATYGTIRYIINDRTITSVSEANLLANAEVARLKDPRKVYSFDVLNPSKDYVSGDVLTINAKSQGVSDEEVRIVKIKRGIKGVNEFLELEVTNKEYSELTKSRDELISELNKKSRNKTYMDGTTNILTFSEKINANNSVGLTIYCSIPASMIEDEISNLRVNSFTVDYDVDPYRRGVGIASESNTAPDVTGSSSSTEPNVTGTSSSTTPTSTAGVSVWAAYTVDIQEHAIQALTYVEANIVGSPTLYTTRTLTIAANSEGGIVSVNLSGEFPSGTTWAEGNNNMSNNTVRKYNTGETSASNSSGYAKFYDANYNATFHSGVLENIYSHTHGSHSHGDGSYVADSHPHADGSYSAASHNHSVSVGDAVSDAGSVNATQVSLYLDFWNGSSWINKHSILNTGKTLDTDVDISNGGTYPDASGFWRVRILTNSASPDLVQGIVKVKHELDT